MHALFTGASYASVVECSAVLLTNTLCSFMNQDGICESAFYDPNMSPTHLRAGYKLMHNFSCPSSNDLVPDGSAVARWQQEPVPSRTHSAVAAIRTISKDVSNRVMFYNCCSRGVIGRSCPSLRDLCRLLYCSADIVLCLTDRVTFSKPLLGFSHTALQ
jgi:hypothetical protein